MSSLRAVFLDFDGTLAEGGVVPPAHVEAVRRARGRARVLLCTGRSKAMLGQIWPIGFDGLVASAGGYVEVDGQVLLDRRFPSPLAARTVEVLDAHQVAYLLEAPDKVLGPPGVIGRIAQRLERGGIDPGALLPGLGVQESGELRSASFAKVSCYDSPVPLERLVTEIGAGVATIESSLPGGAHDGGEIYLPDIHKSLGADLAARAMGVPPCEIMAVGDGMNDLELLEFAGLGVAIEGSDPRLRAVAQRLAPPPGRNGLATLFAELGLTDTAAPEC